MNQPLARVNRPPHPRIPPLSGVKRDQVGKLGLADGGAAVVFITHDMRLVAEYADRAVALCDGEIAFDGAPGALFSDAGVLARARLRPPPVHEISTRLLGDPLLTTAALVERIGAATGVFPEPPHPRRTSETQRVEPRDAG